jgi:hypothetical protein
VQRVVALLSGIAGVLLVGVGIVYLVVACESLPGILGPHAGDTSPRVPLGVACVVFGVIALAVTFLTTRRRPPTTPV